MRLKYLRCLETEDGELFLLKTELKHGLFEDATGSFMLIAVTCKRQESRAEQC